MTLALTTRYNNSRVMKYNHRTLIILTTGLLGTYLEPMNSRGIELRILAERTASEI